MKNAIALIDHAERTVTILDKYRSIDVAGKDNIVSQDFYIVWVETMKTVRHIPCNLITGIPEGEL